MQCIYLYYIQILHVISLSYRGQFPFDVVILVPYQGLIQQKNPPSQKISNFVVWLFLVLKAP